MRKVVMAQQIACRLGSTVQSSSEIWHKSHRRTIYVKEGLQWWSGKQDIR
jgi:hypothetical protein